MQVQFSIPNFFNISTRSYAVAAVLFAAALLSIAVVSLYKTHYVNKKDVKLAKHWIALLLTASSAFFTYLGWLIAFASANAGFLSGLPYVGKHFLAVVGTAYAIYNIRLSAIYRSVTVGLGKFSKSSDEVMTPIGDGVTTSLSTAPTEDQTFEINPSR